MTRRDVHIVLAAPALAATPTREAEPVLPQSVDAVQTVFRFAAERFDLTSPEVAIGSITADQFRTAVASARSRAVARDLVIVMFSGHGDEENVDRGWFFFNGKLEHAEIAELMASFADDVELVLISDACYGKGAIDGKRWVLDLDGSLKDALDKRRKSAPDGSIQGPDIVLVWSADRLVDRDCNTSEFAETLCTQAEYSLTYAILARRMAALRTTVVQGWGVEAAGLRARRPFHADRPAP